MKLKTQILFFSLTLWTKEPMTVILQNRRKVSTPDQRKNLIPVKKTRNRSVCTDKVGESEKTYQGSTDKVGESEETTQTRGSTDKVRESGETCQTRGSIDKVGKSGKTYQTRGSTDKVKENGKTYQTKGSTDMVGERLSDFWFYLGIGEEADRAK